MLDEATIREYKSLVEEANKLSQEKQNIIAEGKSKRDRALEILSSYGYSDLKDISKLQEKLADIEAEIIEDRKVIEAEIVSVHELKAVVDGLTLR